MWPCVTYMSLYVSVLRSHVFLDLGQKGQIGGPLLISNDLLDFLGVGKTNLQSLIDQGSTV